MARRVVYTNPLTGRFISAEDAQFGQVLRRVYQDGAVTEEQILTDGRIADDLSASNDPNWSHEETKWGATWTTEDPMFDLSALQDAAFPDDADAFRVRFTVAANSEYPQGFASSDWFQPENWPPSLSMGEGKCVTGIAMIHFRRS